MSWWLICYVGAVSTALVIATVQNLLSLDASAWASWVQAVGSIGAIFGSVAIANRQMHVARQGDERKAGEELMAELFSYRAAVQAGFRQVERVMEAARYDPFTFRMAWRGLLRVNLDATAEMLEKYEVHKLRSAVAISLHFVLLGFVKLLHDEADSIQSDLDRTHGTWLSFQSNARGVCAEYGRVADVMMQELGLTSLQGTTHDDGTPKYEGPIIIRPS
ncbi:hypothetical protein [Cupriavidus campinensis]|uniref:DUF4760 domain-containing protein n=1 Tax=Cupriavidus campinensis TaxID=151783 RepID=A0ABY3EI82_9BURK|nr:hypothetical protein [Cupriavidus campinensis]TSP10648.1 hypothetical protein FGG12_21380 [Cupriavidus campinensis]